MARRTRSRRTSRYSQQTSAEISPRDIELAARQFGMGLKALAHAQRIPIRTFIQAGLESGNLKTFDTFTSYLTAGISSLALNQQPAVSTMGAMYLATAEPSYTFEAASKALQGSSGSVNTQAIERSVEKRLLSLGGKLLKSESMPTASALAWEIGEPLGTTLQDSAFFQMREAMPSISETVDTFAEDTWVFMTTSGGGSGGCNYCRTRVARLAYHDAGAEFHSGCGCIGLPVPRGFDISEITPPWAEEYSAQFEQARAEVHSDVQKNKQSNGHYTISDAAIQIKMREIQGAEVRGKRKAPAIETLSDAQNSSSSPERVEELEQSKEIIEKALNS